MIKFFMFSGWDSTNLEEKGKTEDFPTEADGITPFLGHTHSIVTFFCCCNTRREMCCLVGLLNCLDSFKFYLLLNR